MRFLTILLIVVLPELIFSQHLDENEIAKVYLTILHQVENKPIKYLIRQTTSYYNPENSLENFKRDQFSGFFGGPPISKNYYPLFDDYKSCTEISHNIDLINELDSTDKIDLFTDQEYQELFNSNQYQSFKKDFGFKELQNRYPGSYGYYSFSWPEFSDDNKLALCYMEYHSSIKAGNGALIFLEKVNDEWKIKYLINLWLS
jgi:hypothetical protein